MLAKVTLKPSAYFRRTAKASALFSEMTPKEILLAFEYRFLRGAQD